MDQQDAAETLRDIEDKRETVRGDLRGMWFPLMLFGSLSILSAAVAWLWAGAALGVFWTVGAVVGCVSTARFYRARAAATGVHADVARPNIVAILIIVGCFTSGAAFGALGFDKAAACVPFLVISAGYAAFGRLEWSPTLTVLAVLLSGLAVWALVFPITAATASILLALVYGGVWVATGITFRAGERRS